MSIWPWSRFAWYENKIRDLNVELEDAEHAEACMKARLNGVTRRAVQVQSTNLSLKVKNTNLTHENMQLQKQLDDAEQKIGELEGFIKGTTPREVLYPPVRTTEEIEAADKAIGEMVGLPGARAAWPFPTSQKP